MISRVAESCFWLTRYVERVATLARLLEVNNNSARLPAIEWAADLDRRGQEEHFLDSRRDAIEDGETCR